MLDDKSLADNLLKTIIETGVRAPLKDIQAMIREFLQLQGKSEGDCDMLTESILYQYAYLEQLISL